MPARILLGTLFALLACCLGGVAGEDTASANALSGITLLSTSVSDFSLSPTIPATGIAFSYHLPFSLAPASVYSLQTAQALGPLLANCGASFLGNEDYRWQSYQLGLALHYEELSLGGTGILLYEDFDGLASYHSWTGNLALSYRGSDYGSEIKLLRLGQPDRELQLSASSRVVPGVMVASTYVFSGLQEDSYRFASSYEFGKLLQLQLSWQSAPARFGAGLKACIGSGELMYAVRTHLDLRLSHSLDLSCRW